MTREKLPPQLLAISNSGNSAFPGQLFSVSFNSSKRDSSFYLTVYCGVYYRTKKKWPLPKNTGAVCWCFAVREERVCSIPDHFLGLVMISVLVRETELISNQCLELFCSFMETVSDCLPSIRHANLSPFVNICSFESTNRPLAWLVQIRWEVICFLEPAYLSKTTSRERQRSSNIWFCGRTCGYVRVTHAHTCIPNDALNVPELGFARLTNIVR